MLGCNDDDVDPFQGACADAQVPMDVFGPIDMISVQRRIGVDRLDGHAISADLVDLPVRQRRRQLTDQQQRIASCGECQN